MQIKEQKEKFVIGLDCSTTSTKAIAFNNRGKIVSQTSVSIPLKSPLPNYYEQNPEDWWNSVREALTKITCNINPCAIEALAISNQRETFVPLDINGKHLRPAIIWLDERCKDEVEPFASKVGRNRIHRITGKPVDYAPVVYRLAWMKKHEPKLFSRIGKVCDVHAYLVWKLTGSFKTSWASADPLGLFDIEHKRWSSVILNALGLNLPQLPEVYMSGSILGRVTLEASRVTGLNPGTLIIAGGGDGQCAGLASNVLSSTRAYVNLGTAVVTGIYGNQYRISMAFRTLCSCSEDGYYYESSLRAGTFAIDWFVKKVLDINPLEQLNVYKKLEEDAKSIPVASDGVIFLPYLCGVMNPYWDVNARGAFVGLSSSHTQGHLYRAILEGIAFEQLFAIKTVERELETKVQDLITIGGGAKSELWCRIIADVTGRNVCIPETTEASALGAGIAAAVGAKWFGTFKSAVNNMSRIVKIIKPEKINHEKYYKRYSFYKNIYPALNKQKNVNSN